MPKTALATNFWLIKFLLLINLTPQLAAAIAAPLTRGYKLDKTRKLLLQQQLMRINKEPTLSKNVYEIINKAINEG